MSVLLYRGDDLKNNIILILVVTVISVAIIAVCVIISAGGRENEQQEQSSASTTSHTSASESTSSVQPTSTTTPPTTTATTVSIPTHVRDTEAAERIVSTAASLAGIYFADDGDSPDAGFDNSGFIYYVLRENGYITCPRGITGQSQMGTVVGYEDMQPGDLVFFYAEGSSEIGYGGIYSGDGRMIACLMPGTQVKEVNISADYYQRYFAHGVSIT